MAMAKVFFTANLRRHVDCASMDADGATVREVLSQVFAVQDRLGTYVLDDQGAVRKHMTILVDGQRIRDLERLSDAVSPSSKIWVMQALSGG
jgi:molybdopterin synthase sulfur carrier subunit